MTSSMSSVLQPRASSLENALNVKILELERRLENNYNRLVIQLEKTARANDQLSCAESKINILQQENEKLKTQVSKSVNKLNRSKDAHSVSNSQLTPSESEESSIQSNLMQTIHDLQLRLENHDKLCTDFSILERTLADNAEVVSRQSSELSDANEALSSCQNKLTVLESEQDNFMQISKELTVKLRNSEEKCYDLSVDNEFLIKERKQMYSEIKILEDKLFAADKPQQTAKPHSVLDQPKDSKFYDLEKVLKAERSSSADKQIDLQFQVIILEIVLKEVIHDLNVSSTSSTDQTPIDISFSFCDDSSSNIFDIKYDNSCSEATSVSTHPASHSTEASLKSSVHSCPETTSGSLDPNSRVVTTATMATSTKSSTALDFDSFMNQAFRPKPAVSKPTSKSSCGSNNSQNHSVGKNPAKVGGSTSQTVQSKVFAKRHPGSPAKLNNYVQTKPLVTPTKGEGVSTSAQHQPTSHSKPGSVINSVVGSSSMSNGHSPASVNQKLTVMSEKLLSKRQIKRDFWLKKMTAKKELRRKILEDLKSKKLVSNSRSTVSLTTNAPAPSKSMNNSCVKSASRSKIVNISDVSKLSSVGQNHSMHENSDFKRFNAHVSSNVHHQKCKLSTLVNSCCDALDKPDVKYPFKVYSIRHLKRLSKEKICTSPQKVNTFLINQILHKEKLRANYRWVPKEEFDVDSSNPLGPKTNRVPKSA